MGGVARQETALQHKQALQNESSSGLVHVSKGTHPKQNSKFGGKNELPWTGFEPTHSRVMVWCQLSHNGSSAG